MRSLIFFSIAATVLAGCATTRYVHIAGPAEDPAGFRRIAEISSKLLPVMDVVDGAKYHFEIAEDDELNAFALSDHTIVVNSGLLHALDDTQLACILAHEIAHVSLGHNARRTEVSRSRSSVFAELKKGASGAGLLSSFIKPFALKEYSREQETEADIEAVNALKSVRISPELYITVLRKLQENAEADGRGKGGGLLADHPSFESRIETIRKMNLHTE